MSDLEHMSKYQRKLARRESEERMRNPNIVSLSIAFQRVEQQKREELPEQKAARAKPKPPQPEARGSVHDLGDRPQRAAKLIEEAADFLRSAEAVLEECYNMGGRGAQQGEPLSALGCVRATYPRLDAVALRVAKIPNLPAPRRGVPEAQKPPRQETGPSPANLEGTR